MKDIFQSLNVKEELSHIVMFHFMHLIILSLSYGYKLLNGYFGWKLIFEIIAFLILSKLYLKTLKNLFYTFWTFSVVLGIVLSGAMLKSVFGGDITLFYFYSAATIILLIECYLLSSPIFFPRVAWWEYDFRYRGDIKVEITYKEQIFNGRLTDLRRGAGCIVLFEDVPLNSEIKIKILDKSRLLKAEVMSKREQTIGRGLTMGIKFSFINNEDRKDFAFFAEEWKKFKTIKKRMKFERS